MSKSTVGVVGLSDLSTMPLGFAEAAAAPVLGGRGCPLPLSSNRSSSKASRSPLDDDAAGGLAAAPLPPPAVRLMLPYRDGLAGRAGGCLFAMEKTGLRLRGSELRAVQVRRRIHATLLVRRGAKTIIGCTKVMCRKQDTTAQSSAKQTFRSTTPCAHSYKLSAWLRSPGGLDGLGYPRIQAREGHAVGSGESLLHHFPHILLRCKQRESVSH